MEFYRAKVIEEPEKEDQERLQSYLSRPPTVPAHRSWFSSHFRSIPYSRTVEANPPRRVTTATSLTELPRFGMSPNMNSPTSGNTSINIPSAFKIYIRLFHRNPHAYIAQRKLQPLYAITYSRGEVTLHRGPNKFSPPIATYSHPSSWNPRKRPAHVRIAGAGPQVDDATAWMTCNYRKVPFDPESPSTFTIEVPAPGNGGSTHLHRLERFEWRPSRGPAVAAALAGEEFSKTHHGMKLVRLATDAGSGGGEIATGGGEVVAVLYVSRSLRAQFSTRGYFMFQGTGAQGILGETFRMTAAMTAVGMWDQKRKERRGGGLRAG